MCRALAFLYYFSLFVLDSYAVLADIRSEIQLN